MTTEMVLRHQCDICGIIHDAPRDESGQMIFPDWVTISSSKNSRNYIIVCNDCAMHVPTLRLVLDDVPA